MKCIRAACGPGGNLSNLVPELLLYLGLQGYQPCLPIGFVFHLVLAFYPLL
jgi:hypothetical protein